MTRSRARALASLLGPIALVGTASAQEPLVPPGDCAGVYWDLTSAFATGDRIYARVLLTRAGPGDLNAAALGHWIDPQGVTTPFRNGRTQGNFQLDAARETLRIGSTRLALAGARHQLVIDNHKRGILIRVGWSARSAGSSLPEEIAAEGLSIATIDLSGAATASVWRRGMDAPRALRGWATLVRTRHAVCERDVATWRVDLHHLGPEGWVLAHQRLASGHAISFLAARSVGSESPLVLAFDGWHGDRRAPLPRRIDAKGLVTGTIRLDHPARLSIDPLEALPGLVRMLYWFGAQPRRVWADASTDIAWAPSVERSSAAAVEKGAESGPQPGAFANGPAIASFTFLHPPDDPNRSTPPDSGG